MRESNAISVGYSSNDDRFWVCFLLSIILHLAVVAMSWFINEQLKKPKLHKVELDNILFLKRGDSLDKNDNTQGTPPPSVASPQSTPPPPPPTPTTQEHNYKEQRQSKRVPLPNDKPQPKKSYQALNQMSQPTTQTSKGMDSRTRRAISELYGREWGDLGSEEKDFVTSNWREIARITQSSLEYPQAAGYLGQQGENAVEFYLLPNGDIEGLRLIRGSKYKLLDDNSTKTIRIAFKDYPRPKKRTLIRFHITYRLH